MIARLGLIAAGVVAWATIGVMMVRMNAEKAAAHIEADATNKLASDRSRLALAAEQTFAARLPEVETLAGVLALGKGLEPVDARRKNSPLRENADALANRTQAAIGTLPGAPLYAIVGANGAVVAATLWPEATVVRAEPGVASALAGVSRLSVWRKDGQPFVLAAAPTLGSDGAPDGALIVARPLGKELCDEIARASGLKLFALSVVHDKVACTGSAEAAAIPPLKAGDHLLLAQSVSDAPLFVDAARVGTMMDGFAFRSEIAGSSIVAGTDLRPAFSALRAEQESVALTHFGLLLPIIAFAALAAWVLGRSTLRMANHLSLVLQQGDKAGMLDEHHYSGNMRRLAKNVNGLMLRAPMKATNEKITNMLGTIDEPGLEEPPLAPRPTPAGAVSPLRAQAPPPSPSPFDDEFEPTRLSAPLPMVAQAPPKLPEAPVATEPPRMSAFEQSFGAASSAAPQESLLSSKSLGASRSLASEEFRFGGDDEPKSLPDLPPAAAPPPPPAPPRPVAKPSPGEISDSEADAALGSLPSWEPEPSVPSLSSTVRDEAEAAAPAGPSPWEIPPSMGLEGANFPPGEAADPDAAHFQDTYDQFVRTRAQCGEPGDLPFGKFVDKLKKSREQVMQKQNCQKVRFQVYVKDGKAALKAVAFR